MSVMQGFMAESCAEARIIDGKAFAEHLREQIATQSRLFREQVGQAPGLAVILVGDDPASQVYVRTKMKKAMDSGIESFPYLLPSTTTQAELLGLIQRLNGDRYVHGILVQLPLPKHIDENAVLAAIDPSKDVDGFHPVNVGRLCQGDAHLVPCTPLGCLMLLKEHLGDLSGMKAVIVGRSNIVGKPMANLLLQQNCTVTILHSRSRDLESECRQADILVLAIGRPQMVGREYVKPGAVIIDVGINRIITEDGASLLVGDADTAAVCSVAGAITPVPGGVGPMTVACLMRNTLVAARAIEGLAALDM
ncbi:bifunctional methylenetetrahydrofolate dehydrogenase/methenyltetrahydrofolate cyclohydrolase FolD [Pseudomonas aeruginosa]|uniref:bifunctional methylenetetrahydrofolate dehydrogenase/methenyltetrahydrofolate cyclohydrolase FolD n=1 Tax=Pseudomonas aeruginosa TaxID=287 RepID=UPI0021C6EC40|nr:bifunctional methylenetetrahydrofolate dehydrogenase/methenyltetrahydrofolate cyclohydrolase FolD [Pseudomonas aeruginosa]MCU9022846.1 bifunctional methylenetetrahydrofolate dehydrogenase/methenyltetrahydrofolate cyclohydrolase FolD [Pseudomonas aeruginosa]MDY1450091.1 bifunctional methylenetetrahydrofolate dehydrogenase/methenyltetrahydrofolate cyclohydrolase FolD [Pseudomonas aeruginosa]